MSKIDAKFQKKIKIFLGKRKITHKVPILCPNHGKNGLPHNIVKNGRDTSTKEKHQQYYCRDCKRSFYAHTSKYFLDLKDEIPKHLKEIFKGGKISVNALATHFHLPDYVASCFMKILIKQMDEKSWNYTPFDWKMRKGHTMIVDETFLTINGKTWFLEIVITDKGEIMGFEILSNRNYDSLSPLLKKCASRLEDGLQILITDGLATYQTFARSFNKDLIHVRHIHKKPFGRLEIEAYHYDHGDLYRVKMKMKNNVITRGRRFKSEVKITKEHIDDFRKVRKVPIHLYSPEAISYEIWIWSHTKVTRRKNKTLKKQNLAANGHFSVSLKKGRVKVKEVYLRWLAAKLELLLPIFAGKHITTNLIENLNLVLQKCIAFGVKRDLENWKKNIGLCCAIRDEPNILDNIFNDLYVPKQTLRRMIPTLLEVKL